MEIDHCSKSNAVKQAFDENFILLLKMTILFRFITQIIITKMCQFIKPVFLKDRGQI